MADRNREELEQRADELGVPVSLEMTDGELRTAVEEAEAKADAEEDATADSDEEED